MLVQFNIAWMRDRFDSKLFNDFCVLTALIYERAEVAAGFMQRWHGEKTAPGFIQPWPTTDPLVMGNLSGWQSTHALHDFTFGDPLHQAVMKMKRKWFRTPEKTPYNVLYYSDELSVREACERLEHLQARGPNHYAFTWKETEK